MNEMMNKRDPIISLPSPMSVKKVLVLLQENLLINLCRSCPQFWSIYVESSFWVNGEIPQ